MARIFTNLTDYLGSTPGTRPWWTASGTVFAQINTLWSSGDSAIHIFLILTSTDNTNSFGLMKYSDNNIYAGWTTGGVDARVILADTGIFTALEYPKPHIVDWDDTANLQHYYINNSLVGTSTTAFTVPSSGTADAYVIGASHLSAASWMGAAAELARWDRVLDASERAILQATGSPLLVPRGLVSYLPIIGRTSPEVELIGGQNLTVNGSPAAAVHPRVFYPASPSAITFEAAVISIPSIQPPLVSNPFQIYAPAVSTSGAISVPVVANPVQLFAPVVTVLPPGVDQTINPPALSTPFTIYAPAVSVQEAPGLEDTQELEPNNFKMRLVNYVAGDDLRISRTYTELGTGLAISKAYLTIKRRAVDNTDAQSAIQKQITTSLTGSGQILDSDTTGGSIQLYFDLSKSDTALLTPLIPYHYDIQAVTSGSSVYTCEKGVIVMQQGVTHTSS